MPAGMGRALCPACNGVAADLCLDIGMGSTLCMCISLIECSRSRSRREQKGVGACHPDLIAASEVTLGKGDGGGMGQDRQRHLVHSHLA